MLIDSTLITDINNNLPYTDKTLTFIKQIVNVFTYVDTSVSGSIITGQVKKGDGTNVTAVTNVLVSAVGGTVAVNIGTAKAITLDLTRVWIQTNSSGAFQVTITILVNALIEFTTSQGIPMFVTL